MKKIKKMVFGLLLITVFSEVVAQGSFDEITIFDASKDNIKSISNSTCSWLKDGDYKPQVKLVSVENGKVAEFTYTGTKGMARSNMLFDKSVKEQIQPGRKVVGIKIIIDCKPDGAGKIDFKAVTGTGDYTKTVTLKSGTNEYLFKNGYPVNKPDWNLVKAFGIWNRAIKGYAKKFNLKQISLLLKKPTAPVK